MLRACHSYRRASPLLISLADALQRTGAATFATKAAPSIKTQLRELYKKVHPDLFHSHPHARDANEKSFKLLQEYLAVAKEGGAFRGAAGVPYRFVFYLHEKPANDNSGDLQAADDGVHKVALTLPPPGRAGGAISGPDQVSSATRRALGKLLAACGLENPFVEEDNFGGLPGFAPQTFTAELLREFIPQAAEILRQSEASQFGPQQRLSAARTALSLGRQITAEFVDQGKKLEASRKADILQQLGTSLDRVPENVEGLHFLLGETYGTDGIGRIRLLHTDDALKWTAFLMAVDLQDCRRQQVAVAAVKAFERSVAADVGLPMICTLPHLALSDTYRDFLDGLLSQKATSGPMFQPTATDFALKVTDRSELSALNKGFSVDSESCLIIVPLGATPSQCFQHCQKYGPQLMAAAEKRRAMNAELELLRHRTERRLRLRKLALDSSVPMESLKACCVRLNQASDEFKGIFDGLSLRIAHVNQVSPGSNYIDISWNFEV